MKTCGSWGIWRPHQSCVKQFRFSNLADLRNPGRKSSGVFCGPGWRAVSLTASEYNLTIFPDSLSRFSFPILFPDSLSRFSFSIFFTDEHLADVVAAPSCSYDLYAFGGLAGPWSGRGSELPGAVGARSRNSLPSRTLKTTSAGNIRAGTAARSGSTKILARRGRPSRQMLPICSHIRH